MARPLRIELAGGVYHVTARGDRREDIYIDEQDRHDWLALLSDVCKRFNWRCHAYCQMTNHYHLLLETADPNLAQGMRQLNGVYTQRVNRRHGWVGHLFQGRYKAILVEKDSYLLELARYVVLNPVRARMVNEAGEWPWSSYRDTISSHDHHRLEWLETDWLLGQFSSHRQKAIRAYKNFVREGVGLGSIWSGLQSQVFLGSDEFVERMQREIPQGDLREVPRLQRRAPRGAIRSYADGKSRDEGIIAAYRSGHYSMREIGDYFGVHYATVSRVVKKAES